MNLEENIRIAFEVYWKNLPVTTELNTGTHSDAFIAGAKSQASKDYWYNEFKRECTPIILDEYSYFDIDTVISKRIGSNNHEDHGKSIIIGVRNTNRLAQESMIIVSETDINDHIVASAHNIQSIVPIADIIPEQIISKQELLLMHDKAMERSITEETYKESRAWDIKKEKKVSHKRTNKRR